MRPPSYCGLALLASFASGLIAGPPAQAQPSPPQAKTAVVAPRPKTTQWTGDLDALVSQQRVIRMAVPYSKTMYYVVKGVQHGTVYEAGKAFEAELNRKYPQKSKNIRIHIIFIVVPRDKLFTYLNNGKVDISVAAITITPERQKLVDFSDPTVSNVSEIVVTGPQSPKLTTLDDLAGHEVFLRKSSSYWEHIERLNERFQREKKPAVKLRAVPEDLEDEDLLEMVNAGLLSATVVDDWAAKLWSRLLIKLQLHPEMAVSSGGDFGWAMRKNSPQLLSAVNAFVKTHRQGTGFGQQLFTKYVASTYMLKQAVSEAGMKRFEQTSEMFRKYSAHYGMDYLLMMAEGYQESGLNQDAKSAVGAIGVMQLMPDTGKQMNVGDIHVEEANIHAGIKYFRTMVEKYYGNEPMDELNKVLFALAAYNCGPGRVRQLRRETAAKELNPNVWINNVEVIAAARVGAETVTYVSNIYKYYVAYKLVAEEQEERRKAKESLKQKSS